MVKRPAEHPATPELRRSGRIPVPARDRDIVYERGVAPKRRRITGNGRDAASSAPDINADCPFLKLSYELLDQIASYLLPREAIYLALTSKVLYHGPLSSLNSALWYRLGRFNDLIPGRDDYWLNNVRWYYMFEASAESKAALCRDENKSPDDAVLSMTFGRRLLPPESPLRKYVSTSEGLPPMGVSYKEMLVSTMLGDTQSGCQWCLQEPLARKVYHGWNMRLCFDCFSENVLPKGRLRKVILDISSLPVTTGRRSLRGGGRISGVFQPTVDRLIRQSYGEDVTLQDLQYEIREVERERYEERMEKRAVYRGQQRAILFSYIKEIWDLLGMLQTASVTNDGPQLANIRETRVGGLDKYGFLPSDEALRKHVPYLSAIAAYIPSGELELDWFFGHPGFSHQDPTVVTQRWGSLRPPLWHNMRWDMRVNQKPAWYVEAAWRVIVQTVCENLTTTFLKAMSFRDGLHACFIAAFKEDLLSKAPYFSTDPGDDHLGLMWTRLAYMWWQGDILPPRSHVPQDIPLDLVRLGHDFKRGVRKQWARFGIQLHDLAGPPPLAKGGRHALLEVPTPRAGTPCAASSPERSHPVVGAGFQTGHSQPVANIWDPTPSP